MKKTPNYNLSKPDQTDFYNVDDFNGNVDIIDTTLKDHADHINNKDLYLQTGERTKWNDVATKAVRKGLGYHPSNDANLIGETSVYALDASGVNTPPVAGDGWTTMFTASPMETQSRSFQIGQKWNDNLGLLWYRRYNSAWENWKQIFLHHNTRLFKINLNDIQYAGTYAIGDEIVNSPNGDASWGALFVTRSADYTHQTYHGLGGTYQRQLVGGSWKPWKRLLTQDDYDSLFTSVSSGKSKVASSTTQMGVPTAADATFDVMAANILKIQSGMKKATGVAYTNGAYNIDVTNAFNFLPKLIIAKRVGAPHNGTDFSIYCDPRIYGSPDNKSIDAYRYNYNGADVNNDGQTGLKLGGFILQVQTISENRGYYWAAFGD
ncbi:pyocin knob domain-containing protein [Lysinibacillus sp. UGB7]|uniref:pyocin knob domain-containing protein n=1 Tax=Lysinibacillus sp. UGB7 TaxID=3411039 RepID=UPI003B810723